MRLILCLAFVALTTGALHYRAAAAEPGNAARGERIYPLAKAFAIG
jgi:hypothetical protein